MFIDMISGTSRPAHVFCDLMDGHACAFVKLDGKDISSDCQIADDENGRAVVLLRNERGQHYVGHDGDVARMTLYGKVEIELRRNARPK